MSGWAATYARRLAQHVGTVWMLVPACFGRRSYWEGPLPVLFSATLQMSSWCLPGWDFPIGQRFRTRPEDAVSVVAREEHF